MRKNNSFGKAAEEEFFPMLVDFVTVVVAGAWVVVVKEAVFSIC